MKVDKLRDYGLLRDLAPASEGVSRPRDGNELVLDLCTGRGVLVPRCGMPVDSGPDGIQR